MSTLSHPASSDYWKPWVSVAAGFLIILTPWLAALVLGTQFAMLNAVVVGATVAVALGVAALVALAIAMFRSE